MTNPIPELQLGDNVKVWGKNGCTCKDCRAGVTIDDGFSLEREEQRLRDLSPLFSARITRRVVVDGKEQEVKIWER